MPVWQRYYLDLILIVAPLYGWYQMARQGALPCGAAGSDPFANPLLFVPVLFAFPWAALSARFPLLMRLLASLAAWLPGTTLLLTLRQLALARPVRRAAAAPDPDRQPGHVYRLDGRHLDSHLADQVYYQVGADLALVELGESTEETEDTETATGNELLWLFLPVEAHLRFLACGRGAGGQLQRPGQHRRRQQAGQIGHRPGGPAQVAFSGPTLPSTSRWASDEIRLAAVPDGILVSSDFLAQQGSPWAIH